MNSISSRFRKQERQRKNDDIRRKYGNRVYTPLFEIEKLSRNKFDFDNKQILLTRIASSFTF